MSFVKVPIIQNEIVICYKCGRFVILNAATLSPSGKRIPLDNLTDKVGHRCFGACA